MGRFLLTWIVPLIVAPLYWLYSLSWRYRYSGDAQGLRALKEPVPTVFAHWHGDELVLLPFYAFKRLAVLSSLSQDGQIMTNVLKLLGYQVFRGSSSRGGARGLIGLIRAVQAGSQSAVAVDGPRGPIYVVKPGVAELAIRTNQPVICVRTRAERAWFIPRAWNKSYVPKPFARIDVWASAPIPSAGKTTEELTALVQATLKK